MSDKPQYTTAIIAAVPEASDPVNDVVIEDAHVTLQFLGEADTLSDEQVEDIKSSLELMASNLYPFPADVAGTAELGPDKAKVLLVQSEPLSKLRELLGTVPAVSTAVAAAEQFPNWIPHLTLAYGEDGQQANPGEIESVQIGSLELWLADEHHVYQLAKAAPGPVEEDIVTASVIAAGLKKFDPNLHPRGADGRFIDKFGIVKYLTTQGWAYGKVEGFYADEGTGAVKVTVTPSDLSGKTTGKESVELTPKQVYRAPTAKAHLTIDAPGAKKIGGQGGSNPGGLYTIPKQLNPGSASMPVTTQEKFYVKSAKKKEQAANEVLANELYEEAGVPVPEVSLGTDGKIYSKIVEGQQDMAQKLSANDADWMDQVRRNFAVDAWLGNRDVFGMTYDNILTDEHGVPWRIDNGGALLYRAMGEKKTDFGATVSELDVFRTGKKSKIFGSGMTKAQELDGAERVVAILPNRIEEMVADAGLPASLADTLKARRLYIANYYGLTLPESQKAPEAQEGSSAPLVDAPDIAKSKGKSRGWFPMKLHQAHLLLQGGDKVEFPDKSRQTAGFDADDMPLSIIGQTNQLLDWQGQHGPDAEIMVYKAHDLPVPPRPAHGQKLTGNDLVAQRWQRGDVVVDSDGVPWKVLGWNDSNGAMLVQFADKQPQLLDTFGKDANRVFTVERWDPPAVETLDVLPEAEAPAAMTPDVPETAPAPEPVTPADESQQDTAPQPVAPVAGKTGQAAEAEAKIKADLDQPLPTGNGAPAPSKTTAPGGAKEMLLGDGTTAQTGAEVVSKKDGKTYKFLKPKGQYAVVTDPNGEDPEKQLLKLASTMTQPGKQPSADAAEMAAPKTATGEVPALGMTAEAKDGWAGTITLISPDGKFVFITDANGKRKRKSTGTVSITGGTPTVVDTVQEKQTASLDGPLKTYGPPPKHAYIDIPGAEFIGFLDPSGLSAADLVVVGYADGSHGVEPYMGQPSEALAQNANGKLFVYGQIDKYQGTISAEQFAAATAAMHHSSRHTVIWEGTIGVTNGQTGPHGGLLIWDADDPASMKIEIPPTGQIITVTDVSYTDADLPETTGQDHYIGEASAASAPLWGDEAKTLDQWKGQLAAGQEISLDGKTWLEIKHVYPTGALDVEDINGVTTTVTPWMSATYVAKAPELKDAADEPKMTDPPATTGIPVLDELNTAVTKNKSAVSDLANGDIVIMPNGEQAIIQSKTDEGDGTFYVNTWGSSVGEHVAGDAQVTKVGNIQAGPVDMEIGQVISNFYPGVKIQLGPGEPDQVLGYPEQLGNGNWQFGIALEGDPDNLQLVEVGNAPGANVGPGAVMGVHFAPSQFPAEFGVDVDKLLALYNEAKNEATTTPPDHYWEMSEQGIVFGQAAYPIYTDGSGGYYRITPSGGQVWDESSDGGSWVATSNTVTGMDQVWEGKASYNMAELVPEGAKFGWAEHATYKGQPGQAVSKFVYSGETYFAVHPNGDPNGPAYLLVGGNQLSVSPMGGGEDWKTTSGYDDIEVVHDPFGLAGDTEPLADEKTVTHHEGPEAPQAMLNRLQDLGYFPEPGDTILAVQRPNGQIVLAVKQPDGTYKVIGWNGELKSKAWTLEEMQKPEHSGEDATFYTWTNVQADGDAPKPIEGLPSDFAPFVPSEGQSVLKTTLKSGIEKVYIQQQPGGGWYALSPDGTVDESSDAIKSNHVVQLKLAGMGSTQVKYDLLHPKPEGQKQSAVAPPTFTNAQGDFTPEPGQKVLSLTSSPEDTDPWFFVQSEPGGPWEPASINPYAGVISDKTAQTHLESGGTGQTNYQLVYGGETPEASVDTPIDNGAGPATPTFHGYIPAPDEKVISYNPPSGDAYYYVQKPGEKHWRSILSDGTVSDHIAVYADSMPENLGPDFGNDYAQEWPLPDSAGVADADTPTFTGYQPKPGEIVVQEPNGSHWVYTPGDDKYHPVNDDGTLDMGYGQTKSNFEQDMQSEGLSPIWPVEESTPAVPTAPSTPAPTFQGYTPTEGQSVIEAGAGGGYWVQENKGGAWHPVSSNGSGNLDKTVSIPDTSIQAAINDPINGTKLVWPVGGAAGGVFDGYQSLPGESVVKISGNVTTMTLVKKNGVWAPIQDGVPNEVDAYSQDTVEWLAGEGGNGTTLEVLQGSLKDSPADAPAPVGVVELEGTGQYAGVKNTTPVWPMTYNFGTYSPTPGQLEKLENLAPLDPGQSLYLLESDLGSDAILIRNSDGSWLSVWADSTVGSFAYNDAEVENYLTSATYTMHKAQWQAPTAPPAVANTLGSAITIGNLDKFPDLPSVSGMGYVASAEDAVGTPAGSWVFFPNPVDPTTSGLFLRLKEDYAGPGTNARIDTWVLVKDGQAVDQKWPSMGQDAISMQLELSQNGLYVQGKAGAPIPQPVGTTPSAPSPAPVSEPVGPQYPGAQAPSQEDINAWGGSLTKDGHIPTPGMFVTGKGPMSGKVISVSKDKTKAVVLTSDGKKTTRLIEALKTDKTANYQAYAAPVTAKDIPQGMPLAVDTVAETLAKTPKDGKFRAILTAHPGVSHGAITVTKATGPSGKVYNRVHLTLTPAQRESILASLAGAANVEKGDWVTSSKSSEKVAIGDLLPMRKSSTNNPDGSPRWKVDPEVKPPTHEVTGVADEPGGAGIKIVTLKDRNTGEEITSRFHPGKSLTTYAWDANKIKPPKPQGTFTLGDIAKADGWEFTTDGGISAATGGAQDAKLKVEPGQKVSTGSSALGQISSNWQTLRNVSADGVVIETVDPKGSSMKSSTGTTVITIPEGVDETALGAAFAKLGIDYSPMTQDSAKVHVRGLLRTLLSLDMSDVDTPKHYTDEMLFSQAGKTMGISDLGWQDVLVGVDESTGKTSYFWSDRARNALAGKAKYNLIYRAASSGNAAQIVSTVKYGSASSMLKKTTGMLDGSQHLGGGASAGTDNGNHAGHGSYASASTVNKLPSTNKQASYKGNPGMMVYHRPDAVLGRIMDYRVAGGDAFGKGKGSGSDHLAHATSMSSVTDYFLGGGLPTEAVGFIAVQDASERLKAIEQLKKDGYAMINGRPVEDIIITKQKAANMTADDLPPVTIPANARPILDLPTSYDAPAADAGAVTASGEDEAAEVAVDSTPESEEVA